MRVAYLNNYFSGQGNTSSFCIFSWELKKNMHFVQIRINISLTWTKDLPQSSMCSHTMIRFFSIGIANVVSRSPRGENFHDSLCEMLSRLHTSQYHWTGLKQPHLKLPLISLFSQKPFQISPLHHQFVFLCLDEQIGARQARIKRVITISSFQ